MRKPDKHVIFSRTVSLGQIDAVVHYDAIERVIEGEVEFSPPYDMIAIMVTGRHDGMEIDVDVLDYIDPDVRRSIERQLDPYEDDVVDTWVEDCDPDDPYHW